MPAAQTRKDISVVGRPLYQERILPNLSPSDRGKVIFVDIETGGYDIDSD